MKQKRTEQKPRIKSILLKILICVAATSFTALAVMFDNPFLCIPAVLLIMIGIITVEE